MTTDSPNNTPNIKPKTSKTNHLPWSPQLAVVMAVVIFLGAQLVTGVLLSIYPAIMHWSSQQLDSWVNETSVQFLSLILAYGLTFAGVWWFVRKRKVALKTLGAGKFDPWYIAYALAGFGVYFILNVVLQTIAAALVPSLNNSPSQDIGFQAATGFGQLAIVFIGLIVVTPIVEELFFRGFLYTSFRKSMSFVWSVVLTSVLFGLPHLFEGAGGALLWVALIDTFILSIVLCYVREKTGSIWSGVGIHAFKNSVAFISLFVLHLH